MKPFKAEIHLENHWEAEQVVGALMRFEGELRRKGFGAWFRLACEVKAARRKLQKDADLEDVENLGKT